MLSDLRVSPNRDDRNGQDERLPYGFFQVRLGDFYGVEVRGRNLIRIGTVRKLKLHLVERVDPALRGFTHGSDPSSSGSLK